MKKVSFKIKSIENGETFNGFVKNFLVNGVTVSEGMASHEQGIYQGKAIPLGNGMEWSLLFENTGGQAHMSNLWDFLPAGVMAGSILRS